MAEFDNDISSAVAQFVYTQSGGNVTEPVNGSYIQAYCEYLGIIEPLNNSWLQALCNYFGITEPLYGSYTIALANYYGLTYPTGGTWWMALAFAGGIVPPVDLIWNEVLTEWQNETTPWATATAPTAPVFPDVTFTDIALPTLVGTASPNVSIYMTIDTYDYQTTSDGLGDWSITLTDSLPQALSPGNDYTANTYAFDPTTGLTSSTTITTVTMITTVAEQTLTFVLNTGWSLGWVYTAVEVQKETAPTVWTSIEYEGNPYWCTDAGCTNPTPAGYYKTNTGPFGYPATIYGINFYQNDPQGMVDVEREIILTAGNYRIIGKAKDAGTNYGQYTSYTVLNGATTVLPLYTGTQTDFSVAGTVQQTFTI